MTRVTTTAANKASVFTESMGEARVERTLQEGGGGGGERSGSQAELLLLQGKNDQGKLDHNGPHRNSRLRPENMELAFCTSWEMIQQ